MKWYVIPGAIIAGIVFLLCWGGRHEATPTGPVAEARATTKSNNSPDVSKLLSGNRAQQPSPVITKEFDGDEKGRLASPEVAFHGLVVDQDSNALQQVTVGVDVFEEYLRPFPQPPTGNTTNLQRQTGADGRFEVSGLKGHIITVKSLTKDGYEPELMLRHHGEYGPQSGSPDEPIVFRMWSTNIREQLISGEKSFVVIPDGRHYGIDLVKGTIAEGDEGDLVAWIKRPESVWWGQKYDWSCEVAIPAGGLVEDSHYGMFKAPEAGYTHTFAHQAKAGTNGWGIATGEKRFYVRLRNGQMFGRITINLYADYYGKQPAMIRLSYAINPSGSRLLR